MDSKERVHLVVNEQKEIPFDTSEAGPGTKPFYYGIKKEIGAVS
jgi:hypothetical protein